MGDVKPVAGPHMRRVHEHLARFTARQRALEAAHEHAAAEHAAQRDQTLAGTPEVVPPGPQ